jgi:2-C-methyl-D-erythritol 2,4-cyclodiphosphate synthase
LLGRNLRIGHGYDIHRVSSERKLWLGGVEIPEGPGLDGHSDADVLIHALMDAILGALGLPDIGALFPNNDMKFKDISSVLLLKQVVQKLEAGWRLVNVDLTLVAERPKIAPYRDAIRANLANALGLDVGCVGLKATTSERLGAIGEGLGMEAHAVVLLYKEDVGAQV